MRVRASALLSVDKANKGILATKLCSLDAALINECSKSTTISTVMPVHFNPTVHTVSQAGTAISNAIDTLQNLYSIETVDRTGQPIPFTPDHPIWSQLQELIHDVPNCMLWSSIQSMQSSNLARIKQLTTDSNRSRLYVEKHFSARECLEQFMMRSRAKHIGIELSRISVRNELDRCYEHLNQPHEDFVKWIYTQHSECDLDLIEEYLMQFTTNLQCRGQLQFLTDELQARQAELTERSAQLKDHAALMSDLQKAYLDSDQRFHETRDACAAIYSIKQKLQALETTTKALVLEARQPSQRALVGQQQGRMLNSTLVPGGGDSTLGSFNMSNNISALCSTRMDSSIMTMR